MSSNALRVDPWSSSPSLSLLASEEEGFNVAKPGQFGAQGTVKYLDHENESGVRYPNFLR